MSLSLLKDEFIAQQPSTRWVTHVVSGFVEALISGEPGGPGELHLQSNYGCGVQVAPAREWRLATEEEAGAEVCRRKAALLRSRIVDDRSAMVMVIGLGYVGLPVALALADLGYAVVGAEVNEGRRNAINDGRCPFPEEPNLQALLDRVRQGDRWDGAVGDSSDAADADIIIICVETPVDAAHRPDYRVLRSVLAEIGPRVQPGTLVIVESTLSPGTMTNNVAPAFAPGVLLAHCPERVMPGKMLANLRTMPRVVGGATPEAGQMAASLYRQITSGDVDVTDALTAEIVKCTENAYRDVQIAFANEIGLLCEDLGSDAWQVRELVNKCPGRAMLYPGAGVGGHCIPKDSWLLLSSGLFVDGCLLRAARHVNEGMPEYVAQMVLETLRDHGFGPKGANVAILGASYLPNCGDMRNSPFELLTEHLMRGGVGFMAHDPHVIGFRGDWREVVQGMDAVVLMTAHDAYRSIDLGELRATLRTPILIDGRHFFDAEAARAAGLVYRCVGIG